MPEPVEEDDKDLLAVTYTDVIGFGPHPHTSACADRTGIRWKAPERRKYTFKVHAEDDCNAGVQVMGPGLNFIVRSSLPGQPDTDEQTSRHALDVGDEVRVYCKATVPGGVSCNFTVTITAA